MLDYKLLVHSFSVAIIQYLCSRYDLPEHWYPRKDLKAQAKVNEYLNWQHANTRMNCAMVFRHLVSRDSLWNHQDSLWLTYCGFYGCPYPWNSILNKFIWWNTSLFTGLHAASNLFLIGKRALLSYDLYFDTEHVIVKYKCISLFSLL